MARFVWDRLDDLRREDAARSRRKSTMDDTELYSVLSFTALTTSKPVLEFLEEFAKSVDREELFDLVVRLFGARNERRLSRGVYEPNVMTDSARDATYSLNLVALALALRDKVYAPDLKVSVEDWQREALFWKSRLSSAEWASVVRGFWVERDRDRHFAVSLRVGTGDREPEWLLMSEPYVTLDEVAVTLRDAVTPLASVHGIEVTAALIELAATPVEKSLPALTRLASIEGGVHVAEVCARIGRGGDDLAILREFGRALWVGLAEVLDAWLRLHERGFCFPDDRDYPDVAAFLRAYDLNGMTAGRPDLLKRAKAAADELGLEWPPSNSKPSRPGRPR